MCLFLLLLGVLHVFDCRSVYKLLKLSSVIYMFVNVSHFIDRE